MLEKGAEEISVISVSFFWTGMVCGRLLTSIFGGRLTSVAFLIFSAGALTVLLLILVWFPLHQTQLLLVFFIGLSAAGIFPCAVTLASLAGKPFTEEITSLFISSASLGGALLSFLIGWAIDASAAAVFRFCCSADWGLAARDQRGDFFIRPAKKQAEPFGYVDLLGRDYKLSRIFFSIRLNRSIFDHNIARKG